jgi:DNA-binding transcriptional ArsR family regulator
MSDIFKALADPTRRDILTMLAKEPTTVNSIADQFQMSRPAVSRHIKILHDSQLVSMEQNPLDGRYLNCYAQLEVLKEVEDYMKCLESLWKERLDRLGKYLDSQPEG